ncbi:hypothetical protein F4815DRAFT_489443 [Daldinia loculata]|nr:hypothetical protein F4815DRAFT_489443 [Daldinia loculata]
MQLKLLALLGALAPIANAQNKTVVPQNNTLVSQNNTIVITDNLVDIINNFPSCSLPCFSDAIHLNRCRVKELDCVCHWALVMSDDLTPCTRKQCKGSHNDVRARLWDFCHRWDEHPPAAEVEAAQILMRKRIVDQYDWLDRPTGRGRSGGRTVAEPDLTVMGAAVAVAAALMV